MRIAVLGGGPGGLYFAALARQLDARHDITVWERNAADDTFGFGVVFSDETLGGIEHADPEIFRGCAASSPAGTTSTCISAAAVSPPAGTASPRWAARGCWPSCRSGARRWGCGCCSGPQAPAVAELAADYDLVVAADGMNSAVRGRYAEVFGPDLERRRCRYIWLGTDLVFDAFKFYIVDTPDGMMQVHAYPYSASASTFIVETHEDVWRGHGFGPAAERAAGLPPGTATRRPSR